LRFLTEGERHRGGKIERADQKVKTIAGKKRDRSAAAPRMIAGTRQAKKDW
jgi:hypothetical protein